MKILFILFLTAVIDNLLIKNTVSFNNFKSNPNKRKLNSKLPFDLTNQQLTRLEYRKEQRRLRSYRSYSNHTQVSDYSTICVDEFKKYQDVSDFCNKYKDYSNPYGLKMDEYTKKMYKSEKEQIYFRHPEIKKSKKLKLPIWAIIVIVVALLLIIGIAIICTVLIKKYKRKYKSKGYRYYRQLSISNRSLQTGDYLQKLSLEEVKKTVSKYGKQRVYDIVSNELRYSNLPLMSQKTFNQEYDQLMDVVGSFEGVIEQRVKQNKPFRKLLIKKIRDFALHRYNIDIANHADELKVIMTRFKKSSPKYLAHLLLGNRLE